MNLKIARCADCAFWANRLVDPDHQHGACTRGGPPHSHFRGSGLSLASIGIVAADECHPCFMAPAVWPNSIRIDYKTGNEIEGGP